MERSSNKGIIGKFAPCKNEQDVDNSNNSFNEKHCIRVKWAEANIITCLFFVKKRFLGRAPLTGEKVRRAFSPVSGALPVEPYICII